MKTTILTKKIITGVALSFLFIVLLQLDATFSFFIFVHNLKIYELVFKFFSKAIYFFVALVGLTSGAGLVYLKNIYRNEILEEIRRNKKFGKYEEVKPLLRPFGSINISGELSIGVYRKYGLSKYFYNLDSDLCKKHTLLLGPNGSGQSFHILLPNCYFSRGASFIVTDPTGTLWEYTKSRQINPLRFAPHKMEGSMWFNFVVPCKDREVIKVVVNSMVFAYGIEKGEQLWTIEERELLALLLSHTAFSNIATPAKLYDLLCSSKVKIIQELSYSDSEWARTEFSHLLERGRAFSEFTISSLKGKLAWLASDTIQNFTSMTHSAFDFASLKNTRTQIYWGISANDQEEYHTLTTIFFNLAMYILERSDGPIPVKFMIGDLSTLGHLINLEECLNLFSKKDISFVAGITNSFWLEYHYGSKKALALFESFKTKIVLGRPDDHKLIDIISNTFDDYLRQDIREMLLYLSIHELLVLSENQFPVMLRRIEFDYEKEHRSNEATRNKNIVSRVDIRELTVGLH